MSERETKRGRDVINRVERYWADDDGGGDGGGVCHKMNTGRGDGKAMIQTG